MCEILKRALMTAVEGFFVIFIPELCAILSAGWPTDWHTVWAYLLPIIGAALGAGISAGWNYILEHKPVNEVPPIEGC